MIWKDRLDRMWKGWFVGAFEPTAYHTDCVEVGVKRYKAGDSEPEHYHKIAIEITVVIEGKVRINGVDYSRNDIIVRGPWERAKFNAVTDATTVVVKQPAILNDKYEVDDDKHSSANGR